MANAFWLLLLLPTYLNWRTSQYEQRLLFVAPSEETLQKLESNGVTREQVTQFLQAINGTYRITEEINTNLYDCDNRFRVGNLTNNEFVACADFVLSYTKHDAQILADNAAPLSVINSSR